MVVSVVTDVIMDVDDNVFVDVSVK
jgi:hypothetical protein